MLVKLFILAVAFCLAAAFPLQPDQEGAAWSHYPQSANQAREKTHVNKDQTGMWKSHVENSDLYSQNPPHPLAEESLQKPALVSQHLRTRLRQQLAELRARLWPGSAAPSHTTVTAVRDVLTPLTEQLQSALSANVHNLCHVLRQHLQELQPAVSASGHQGEPSYQALVPQMGRSLEESARRMTGSILEFRARSAAAAEQLQEAGQREGLLEVANRIGQEAAALEEEFRRRVGGLQASLGSLLLSAPPHADGDSDRDGDADVTASATRFCQHTRALIQQFSRDMEGQFSQLERGGQSGGQGGEEMPPLREDFLGEDFTSRLHSLLQEIMQTLNY
ncbi:hypothetical protein ACEWY4_018711 [Coilia grayii]|uniref:Apolipoprotein A-V n=1 Tax=Coilia grayii TaxID=363190 RepID=A0ABD1JDZ5_9TELE